jgi:hypothetical protein
MYQLYSLVPAVTTLEVMEPAPQEMAVRFLFHRKTNIIILVIKVLLKLLGLRMMTVFDVIANFCVKDLILL